MTESAKTRQQLSVVVIGRNEGERLVRCLESVFAVTPRELVREVICVDSASSDGSVALARATGAEIIALTGKTTAALARNAGWRAASSDFVLFLDGDTVLHPQFAADALGAFDDPSVAVVWGHRRELYPRNSLYNRVLDLDWIYAPGEAEFCGGDAIFRRETLKRTGGFDPALIAGEEPELCRRIRAAGGRILHLDLAMTSHDLAITHFPQYWRRAVRAGHAYAEVSARFSGQSDAFWQGQVRGVYLRVAAMLAAAVISAALAAAFRSWWPIAGLSVLACAAVLRTAWRARWKCANALTLVLYGAHSHFQQAPICVGQLRWRLQQPGVKPQLLEYK